MHKIIGLILLGCLMVPALTAEPADYTDKMAYEVFSAALGLEALKGLPALVDKHTAPNRSCVQVSGPLASKIEEAGAQLRDLERNVYTLQDAFKPPGKVELSSIQEASAARKPASMGWRPFTTFSPVGFSHDGSVAVVFIGYSCGMMCGSWRTAIFSRHDDGWAELRGENHCLVSVS